MLVRRSAEVLLGKGSPRERSAGFFRACRPNEGLGAKRVIHSARHHDQSDRDFCKKGNVVCIHVNEPSCRRYNGSTSEIIKRAFKPERR